MYLLVDKVMHVFVPMLLTSTLQRLCKIYISLMFFEILSIDSWDEIKEDKQLIFLRKAVP